MLSERVTPEGEMTSRRIWEPAGARRMLSWIMAWRKVQEDSFDPGTMSSMEVKCVRSSVNKRDVAAGFLAR